MKTILYILHFNERDWIKIGITKNLKQRIKTLKSDTGFTVDYANSIIITNNLCSNIRLLERNLLTITNDFALNWRHDVKFSGMDEFRKNNCTNLIQQWVQEQRNYGMKFKIYTGIDVCGQYYKKAIPKVYFPIDKTVKGISPILKNDINDYCKENNIAYREILNSALYNYAIKIGINRVDEIAIEGYDNFYKI